MGARQCQACDEIMPHGAIFCPRCRTRLGAFGSRAQQGIEAALQHIEEARQFSSEVGGADRVVKDWLFELSPQDMVPIMKEYERLYGKDARDYAAATLPQWKFGKVQMSGMVAKRFFDLLPFHMPLGKKYSLARDLWAHAGPRSNSLLRVGADAPDGDVMSALHDHMGKTVNHHSIPEYLKKQFDWLGGDDIAAGEQILNRLMDDESALVLRAASEQLQVLRNRSTGHDGRYVHSWCQEIKVGNHKIVIEFDRSASGVALIDNDLIAEARRLGGSSHRDRIPSGQTTTQVPWFRKALSSIAVIVVIVVFVVLLAHLD